MVIADTQRQHGCTIDAAEAIANHLLNLPVMEDDAHVAQFIASYQRAITQRDTTNGLHR